MAWKDVHGRVWTEAAKAAGLDTRVKVVMAFVGQAVTALLIWLLLGETALAQGSPARVLAAVAPFLMFPILYLWKLATVPVAQYGELQAKIAALEAQAAAQAPVRDPDGVYQLGERVGRVVNPDVKLHEGTIFFPRIIEANQLNLDAGFEWRNFTLEIIKHDGSGQISFSGAIVSREAYSVLTRIVAR